MPKSANATDKHIGTRLRMRRLQLGMSQTALADALGVTFQQVQKYEKGVNRIGAGRLQRIANVLQAPVSFFFENAPGASERPTTGGADAPLDHMTAFMASADGLALSKSFMSIKDSALRRSIVALVEQLSTRG